MSTLLLFMGAGNQTSKNILSRPDSQKMMLKIYEEVKTPFKYGIILNQPDATKMVDSPTVFRFQNLWYMSYIIYDGRGYETWLAKSKNLLEWDTLGRILSFNQNSWDANQKAGYPALIDYSWAGSYEIQSFNNTYWMSYLGGSQTGYEKGTLGIGLASTTTPFEASEWTRFSNPILLPTDPAARWFENQTIYKSTIIFDEEEITGYPFVMFYNAKNLENKALRVAAAERIGMAVSKNMTDWTRLGREPVIDHGSGISGDAQITRIGDIWIMFYFGAFWKPGAFERFACSYDLTHWLKWEGEDLIAPSEDFDKKYAHKPWVIKYNGIVYHFYCAVGDYGRVIALATSKDIGTSTILKKLRSQK